MTTTEFGRYLLRQRLGQGGMGAVYLGHDPLFERDVAIKLLPQALLHDPDFLQRFEREAKLIANLEHYAIVPVYDYGKQDGQPFIVMRLMTGGTLEERLKRGPLPLSEISPLISRICSALETAHARNIVHRDIKPANIMFDREGAAYLADFGIARLAEGTQTMTIIGTPQYMAPEQAHGRALDPRTDVYQLGVVLFEMLTGQIPFQADTPAALLHQHAYEPPPSPRRFNNQLPPSFEAVVLQAMAKDQNQRYQTALDLANAVESAAKIGSSPPPAMTELLNMEAENRMGAPAGGRATGTRLSPWLIGGAALSLLAVLITIGIWFGGRNNDEAAFAAEPAVTAADMEGETAVLPTSPPTAAAEPATPPVVVVSVVATVTAPPATAAPTYTPPPTNTSPPPTSTAPPPTNTPPPTAVPAPVIASRANDRLFNDIPSLWTLASFRDRQQPGQETYRITVDDSDAWRWSFSWCADSSTRLAGILAPLTVEFLIDGEPLHENLLYLHPVDEAGGWECQYWTTILSGWEAGRTVELTISYQLQSAIFDGVGSYAPGSYAQTMFISVR